MTSEIHLAYLAGFFDGEGSVLITKNRQGPRYRRGEYRTPQYRLQLSVANTNHQSLVAFRETFGGSIHRLRQRPNRKPAWQWYLASRKAAVALRALLGFLQVKRREAEIGLALQEAIDTYKRQSRGRLGVLPTSQDEIERRDRMFHEIRAARREQPTEVERAMAGEETQ